MSLTKVTTYLLFFAVGTAFSQPLTEQAVLDSAIKFSPLLKAAELQVKQNNYLRATAFNLPNPEVMAESPTGTFYAVGILQSMEFPTVYIKQGQLLKQQALLAEKGKAVTTAELRRLIRSLYLNAQYSQQLRDLLRHQDSLYNQLQLSAKRQFDAGVIDYLAKTFAEAQAGEIRNQYRQAENTFTASLQQLQVYSGILAVPMEVMQLTKLDALTLQVDTATLDQSPIIQYAQQSQRVNQKQLGVERNRLLPGLVAGYLNQGEKNTETYYRFRVGFTVPLWFWQYNGSIKAAKAGVQLAQQQTIAQQQQLMASLQTSLSEYASAQQALTYYETSGARQADDIVSTGKRLFESGQIDYIAYIRNSNDAYAIKKSYLETIRNYNLSILNINYLIGDL